MKRSIIILVVLLLVLSSCEKQIRNDSLEQKKIELNENIKASGNLELTDTEERKSIDTVLDIETLFPDKIAVEKKDANLDLDNENEQFIVLVNSENLITFIVADFNKITREYFPAWQVDLPILYNSDFTISEQDVLGIKQNLQLVLTGTTKNSSNTLFIFQKTAPPKGLHIYYKNIYKYDTDGSATLVEKSRDLSYIEKNSDLGQAYDILVEKTNIVNENTVNVVTENWVWDRRRNKFFRESTSSVEQKVNVKEKLRAVFRSSKKDFIKFISGEWLLDDKIIIIDHKTNTVTLKYKNGVENFRIKTSWRGYQRITLNLVNLEVATIQLKFSITLKSTDQFTLANTTSKFISNESTIWDGGYVRLNNDVKTSLVSDTNIDIMKEPQFTGVFKNVSHSLNFSYPEYKKINLVDNTTEEGIFTILELSNDLKIMQLKTKSETRSEFKVNNYKLEYQEQVLESQIIRTLKLHEGVLKTHGIELKPDSDSYKYEQTEVLNNE